MRAVRIYFMNNKEVKDNGVSGFLFLKVREIMLIFMDNSYLSVKKAEKYIQIK